MSDLDLTDVDWTAQYIDGEYVAPDDGDTISVEDPSTREQFAEVPAGTTGDVDAAYEAAAAAQDEWASRPPQQRASVVRTARDLLKENRDEILDLLAAESGSTRTKGMAEFYTSVGITGEAASFPTRMSGDRRDSTVAGKENIVVREPKGVVGVISPWNFPLNLSIRAVAPAIATGNSVVLKPATNTPVTGGLLLAKLFEAAGLPEGVLNVVTGHGSEVGDRIAGHPEADVVAFTGSTEVGKQVAGTAATNLATPAMELGGNNVHIVTEDADLDRAIDGGVFGSFLHSGQVCISVNRHLVHEDVYDEYVHRLTERAEELPTGTAHEPQTVVGPSSTSPSATRSSTSSSRRSTQAPPSKPAAATTASSSNPRSSRTPPTTWPPRATSTSARSLRSSRSRTTTRPSRWPTRLTTASPAPSTRATSGAPATSPTASTPG